MNALPEGLLLAYYGDDFTGSTDVMEVLTFAGLPHGAVPRRADAADLARFARLPRYRRRRHRAQPLAGMDARRTLPPALRALDALGAPILHYKVCSTFDSSAADRLDRPRARYRSGSYRSCLVSRWSWRAGAAALPGVRQSVRCRGRRAHRLDRHPTMAHHPVTPMAEADLRLHLAHQTSERVALIDLVALKSGAGQAALERARADGVRAVLFDVVDDATLAEAGRLIWQARGDGVFAVASSGLEYALVAHWRAAGLLPPAVTTESRGAVDRLLVVSGSCSPVTEGQIGWAVANGFVPVRLDVLATVNPETTPLEIARAADAACDALGQGRDTIVFSAQGPRDAAIATLRDAASRTGRATDDLQRDVAAALGEVLARVVERSAPARVVVAGGDTSGEATGRLDIHALEAVMPLAPGGPLCLAHRRGRPSMEIVLKGGQIGGADFFGHVKQGAPPELRGLW